MEREESLPYPQETATDLCPEPGESSPHRSILFSKIHFNIILPSSCFPTET
jgi:hypothetical protein